MSEIKKNLELIETRILSACKQADRNRESVRLVAVSKTKPVSMIKEALVAGQTIFGENYIQDAVSKISEVKEEFPSSKFHFIGHLQRNKAKLAVKHFDMIQTVDSLKLAEALANEASKEGKAIEILAQVNISAEESKSGARLTELDELVKFLSTAETLKFSGFMSIGSLMGGMEIRKAEFSKMHEILLKHNENFSLNLSELSMGMSEDFEEAILEGASLIRIGSKIFGARE